MSGGSMCETIRICYQNNSQKCCKKVCEYSIALKRINDIVLGEKNEILQNKIAKISTHMCAHTHTHIYIYIYIKKKRLGGPLPPPPPVQSQLRLRVHGIRNRKAVDMFWKNELYNYDCDHMIAIHLFVMFRPLKEDCLTSYISQVIIQVNYEIQVKQREIISCTTVRK